MQLAVTPQVDSLVPARLALRTARSSLSGLAIIQAQLVQGATPLPGVSTLTFALNVQSSSAGGGGSSSTSPSMPVNDGLIIEVSGKGYWAQCLQWGPEVGSGALFISNLAVGIPLLTVFDSRFGIEDIVAVYQSDYAPDAERYDDARCIQQLKLWPQPESSH